MNKDFFEFSSDITFNEFEDRTYLNFISTFVNQQRENYITIALCFGIGLNCTKTNDFNNYTDLIEKEEFCDSFNVPRTILNKADVKNKLRMYYIIALTKKRKEYVSNEVMQNIWTKNPESEDFKEAEHEFKKIVLIGARKFVETYFDVCDGEISLVPKYIYQLESDIEIRQLAIEDKPVEIKQLSVKEKITILEKQKREIEEKIYRLQISKEEFNV